MECPRCQAGLIVGAESARCPDGHGRFIPAEVLAKKVAIHKHLAKADTTLPSIPCPACRQQMVLVHPKKVDVDVCPCGAIWLDAGEEKVLRESGGGGLAAWATVDILSLLGSLLG